MGEEQGQDLGDLGASRRKDPAVEADDLERSDEVESHGALSFRVNGPGAPAQATGLTAPGCAHGTPKGCHAKAGPAA
ncbi:hypothetical protein GCM10017674_71110 [Streptomyces gardneri]|uniref:Uncharacterized protein n=1 Tax=Streptomyces gardneri TaxID=66892 RepID=A0A4Y3RGC4_9ACTN|nr:hypothetical protein SGA01_13620 [Streptomyces gardneri]GHH18822.1 hypothetical protein GCM10017674_71110 [Streptomyces gardneri]